MPLYLPGALTSDNRNAIDWHNCGLLAYACQNTLVCIDVNTLKVFQTLTKHYAPITWVSWQPSSSFNASQPLRCASTDSAGHIIVWNVIAGQVAAKFFSQNHAVYEMGWLAYEDNSCDFLLVLHSKTLIVLWNINSSEPVWQSRLGFNAFGFSLDPFNNSNIAFSLNNNNLAFGSGLGPHQFSNLQPEIMVLHDNDKHSDCSIQQLVYHRAYPNLVFVVLKNQLFCVNSVKKQIVCNISLSCSLLKLLPCADRDAFYTVQTNGLVSLYTASFQQNSISEVPLIDLEYKRACCTEVLRGLTKSLYVTASALCPVYETHVALLYNTGKLIFYQLQSGAVYDLNQNYRILSLKNHIHLNENLEQAHKFLRQTYHLNALSANVTVLRIRPMNVIDDTLFELGSMHLAAVATASGIVHLVDVFNCRIVRSFQIHSASIKCMEWAGNLIVSASSSASLSSSSTVKNELFACDIQTGQKQRIRPEADESAIEMLRVSCLNRYLALVFRHDPLEIWDLHSMRMLRKMSKKCPIIVDMVWFGKKKTEGDELINRENLVILDVDNRLYHVIIKGIHVRDGKEVNTEWKNNATILRLAYKQELLVFGDSTGRIRVWDLVKKQSRQTSSSQSNLGPVTRLAFTSLAGDTTIAVQHASSIAIWDVDNLQLLQLIGFPGLNVVDADMCGVTPVYVLSDGALRYSSSNNDLCAPIPENEIPLLLNKTYQKSVLKFARNPTSIPDEFANCGGSLTDIFREMTVIDMLQSRLEVAYTFLGQTMSADLLRVVNSVLFGHDLSCRLWTFWPRERFKKRMEIETKMLMKQCVTSQHIELATEKAIALGQRDWATYLLLNFEQEFNDSSETLLSAYKACLLAANLTSEESQCLVKLTATNLIASGYLSDGVQLLYLINQEVDACRYLAAQGDWSRSFSYSKLLPNNEAQEVLEKYIQYLTSLHGSKSLIVLLYASFGDWNRCKQVLCELHYQELTVDLCLVLEQK